jgi:hypothetical protein
MPNVCSNLRICRSVTAGTAALAVIQAIENGPPN